MPSSPHPNVRPGSNGTILVVDDIADNRALLGRRLEQRGFAIVEAESGDEALEKIWSRSFDLVLLDVMMPGLNGFQVLERVRQQFDAAELPVIMVTARHEAADIVMALQLGANDYVAKPIDFPVVLARVSAQIQRRRAELALREANAALQGSNDALVAANEQLREAMTQRRVFEERVDYLAHYDGLTGLPNRQAFMQQIQQAIAKSRGTDSRVAFLSVGLDGVRDINEALGHSVGECLVKAFADRMVGEIAGTYRPGRLGPHEFGVIHVSTDPLTAAAALANRILEIVRFFREVEGHDVCIRAGIGIACNDDVVEAEDLFQMADLAMARARAHGSDQWRFFHPDMDIEVRARRSLEIDLRVAVAERQFDLHYQPILNLEQQRIGVFEALLRWNHPKRGPVSPLDIIPIAEATGLIIPLGEWVLQTACLQAVQWPADIKVAVNISPLQFRDGRLLSTVRRALADSGLAPVRLQIEITESVLLGDSEANLDVLRDLRSLGVQIAIDDFGTGYSSLSYLRSFCFDKVKLDKSFVRDMCSDSGSRAIVRSVAGLGGSFGMAITAEGVETPEQLACLRADGYTEIQGYLIGKPQPFALQIPVVDHFTFPRAA